MLGTTKGCFEFHRAPKIQTSHDVLRHFISIWCKAKLLHREAEQGPDVKTQTDLLPRRFGVFLKPPSSKTFNPFPSLSRESAEASSPLSFFPQFTDWRDRHSPDGSAPPCPYCPLGTPLSSSPTPFPAPQQTTSDKIATETPWEINGSAYSDCE